MNWEQIRSKWLEYEGQVRQRWGKLTDVDLTAIDGNREVLAERLLERTGNTKEQVEKEIAEFEVACNGVAPAVETA